MNCGSFLVKTIKNIKITCIFPCKLLINKIPKTVCDKVNNAWQMSLRITNAKNDNPLVCKLRKIFQSTFTGIISGEIPY